MDELAKLGELAELVAVFLMTPAFPIPELLVQVQVTLDCNSRCSYCFQEHLPGVMPLSIVAAIIDRVVHFHGDRRRPITFIWHGGEPLLAGINFFKKLVSIQNRYPHVRFKNQVQTNATLMTRDAAAFFCDHDFEVGFSIDGPKAIHNRHRKFKNDGPGSFSKTMAGVDNFRRCSSREQLPVIAVVTKESICRADAFFSFFLSLNARVQLDFYDIRYHDFQLSSNLDPSFEPPDPFEMAPSPREVGSFLIRLFDLWFWDESGTIDFPELRDEVKMILQPEVNCGDPFHKKRCSLGRIIFAPDGRAYSCDQYVNDAATALGDVRQDSLELMLVRKAQLWERIKRHTRGGGNEMACYQCEWGNRHAGGCLSCMKYNAMLLAARHKGLPDREWIKMKLPLVLKKIRGETYYCEGLSIFRNHVKEAISGEFANG